MSESKTTKLTTKSGHEYKVLEEHSLIIDLSHLLPDLSKVVQHITVEEIKDED